MSGCGRCRVLACRYHSLPVTPPCSRPWTFWKKPSPCRKQGQLEWGRRRVISCDCLVRAWGRGRVHQGPKVCVSVFMSVWVYSFVLGKDMFWQICVNGRARVRVYTCMWKSRGHTPTVFSNSPLGLFSGHPALPLSRERDLGPWTWLSPTALFCSVMPQIGQTGYREHQAQIKSHGEKTCCPL